MDRDEQAIRDVIGTWLQASKAGDTQEVLNLMADDVVFLVPGQPPMRGKSAFAASQSALAHVEIDATSDIQEITVFGDWAYAWTKLTVVMKPKNGQTPVKRGGNTLSIFKKDSGRWILFRDANMLSVVSS
jgi:uncharacterized protein (TIGR02246 family)